jgi:hypothetical protein
MKGKKIGSSLLKVVLLLAIAFVIYTFFIQKEGFELGSSLDYRIGEGVDSSWENKSDLAKPYSLHQSLDDNVGGKVPLPEGELLIFKENKFDPKCCPSVYSNSTGCVCATPEQMSYLNQRGGNRTFSSMY